MVKIIERRVTRYYKLRFDEFEDVMLLFLMKIYLFDKMYYFWYPPQVIKSSLQINVGNLFDVFFWTELINK